MSKGSKKSGCGSIAVIAVIILFIIGGIGSCVGGDEEETTTTTTEISTTIEDTTEENSITIEDTTEENSITIESIEFSDSDPLELNIGDSEYSYIRVVYNDEFSEDDITFVSSDESVATITLNRKRNSLVYFDIEAIGAGTATVYAQTVDGAVKSEEITVTVEEETTTEEPAEEETQESSGRKVYVTPSGKRYHYSSSCAGENGYQISIDNVGNRTACQKCAQ